MTWRDVILYPLARLMGCPCCGPEWYRALFRWADDGAGRDYHREYVPLVR